MPVRKLLAERVTRWSPGGLRNSGSAWGADVPVTAPSPCNSLSATAPRVIRVRTQCCSRHISVDPTRVTTDLRDARAAIKQALRTLRETPDDSWQLLWLAPFTPKRAWKRMFDAMPADPDLPVFCSNLGDLGSVFCRLDGTDSEFVIARATAQRERRQWLERTGGQMMLQSWLIRDKIRISVGAYQPGAENTKPALRELAARTLAEFDLTGEVD